MKTKIEKKSAGQKIEQLCENRATICMVLALMVFGLIKLDSSLIGTLRQSYSQGTGLLDAYMREEPTRTPPNIGSEMRLTSISGA